MIHLHPLFQATWKGGLTSLDLNLLFVLLFLWLPVPSSDFISHIWGRLHTVNTAQSQPFIMSSSLTLLVLVESISTTGSIVGIEFIKELRQTKPGLLKEFMKSIWVHNMYLWLNDLHIPETRSKKCFHAVWQQTSHLSFCQIVTNSNLEWTLYDLFWTKACSKLEKTGFNNVVWCPQGIESNTRHGWDYHLLCVSPRKCAMCSPQIVPKKRHI